MTSQLPLPADGLYTITKARPQLLASLQNTVPGTDVVLLPPSVGIGVGQRWDVKRTPSGNYTIINRGNYLSFDGPPVHGKLVRGYHPPREWRLLSTAVPNTYRVVVPGGPFNGQELALMRRPWSLLRL
ncbi:hypothetical protein BJV77DRAFT_1151688 [Russula vinacea]|nr:hypothetical protein BJV77DRAFT_1151688 [Russula vinacea]